jgi:hypothetical protein
VIALTKTADERDYPELAEELKIVDLHFDAASPQHPMRRWEYAMALRAHASWVEHPGGLLPAGPVYDVGGAGSPFYRMMDPYQTQVIDPAELHGKNLDAFLREGPRLGSLVFCLSVIEHVDDLDLFVYHLSCLTAPGGLLFLTMDFGDTTGHHHLSNQDPFHFHWMRKRIFTPRTWGELGMNFLLYGFQLFGGIDRTYHGPTVYDYTFASLCLQKRS